MHKILPLMLCAAFFSGCGWFNSGDVNAPPPSVEDITVEPEYRLEFVPTFEDFDKGLDKYKKNAELQGETNAHFALEDFAYYSMFDLVLTVLHDPTHPRYQETARAWASNQSTFKEQAGMIATILGTDMIPLLLTASERYATDFQKNSTQFAKNFDATSYVQPGAVEVDYPDGTTYKVAWFHGRGDADGDGESNRDELKRIDPDWRPSLKTEGRPPSGNETPITVETRDRLVQEALGVESWRTKPRPLQPIAEPEAPAENE